MNSRKGGSDHPRHGPPALPEDNIITAGLAAVAVIVSGALSSLVTLIISRRPAMATAEAAQTTADAAAQNSVNEGFAKLSSALLDRMGALEEQNKALQGEIENLTQHVYSLEKILRDNGLPIPVRVRPAVFVAEAGKPN